MKANNKIVTAVTGTRAEFFDVYLELSDELRDKYYYKFKSFLGSDEFFDRILFTPSEWREIDENLRRPPLPVTGPMTDLYVATRVPITVDPSEDPVDYPPSEDPDYFDEQSPVSVEG